MTNQRKRFTSTDMTRLGDVTADFLACAGPLSGAALSACDIRIERYEAPVPPDSTGWVCAKSAVEHKYRVVVDAVVVIEGLGMPRDVFNVLAGIAVGRGVAP